MPVDRDFLKQLADFIDGDEWRIADLLVEQFPPEDYGEGGTSANTGLHAELEQYETELASEYGVELKASTMRRFRTTALAWPRGARAPRASFDAHLLLRGKDRQDRMRLYLEKMKREDKQALSRRIVMRYRSEEKPAKPGVAFETQVARSINSTAKRLVLGNVIADRDDWWNAKAATANRRELVVKALRKMASDIASAG